MNRRESPCRSGWTSTKATAEIPSGHPYLTGSKGSARKPERLHPARPASMQGRAGREKRSFPIDAAKDAIGGTVNTVGRKRHRSLLRQVHRKAACRRADRTASSETNSSREARFVFYPRQWLMMRLFPGPRKSCDKWRNTCRPGARFVDVPTRASAPLSLSCGLVAIPCRPFTDVGRSLCPVRSTASRCQARFRFRR
jgi:hypothetical protein